MSVWLSFLVVASALFLLRRAKDRRLALATGVEPEALRGAVQGVPVIASVIHLEPRAQDEALGSPYRRGEDERAPAGRSSPVDRAKAALANARWLLASAIDEAAAAEGLQQRGDRRGADLRRLAQTTAECEALQCIFEAEQCLGTRIVREPDEPRCMQRFYGQAAQLLEVVGEYTARAFPRRTAPRP